jgi:hypothetical protein
MENSSIINSTMGDLGAYYVPQKYYDPNSSIRICCVELPNNSLIYIKYEKEWTVKDLINAVIKTKQFNLIYNQRDYLLDSLNHLNLFDLQICLYRQIKPDYENKISFDVKIDALHEKGLLKNYKYPFFIFKDNRSPFSFNYCSNQIKSDILKSIIDSEYDGNAIYSFYLPRANPIYKINSFPQLEDYFYRNKKGYNDFTPFNLNPLLNEHDQFDWFIYDNESMNFLINMNKTNIEIKSKLKLIKNKLYFIDTTEDEKIIINEEKLKHFFLNLLFEVKNPEEECMDLIKKKVKITLKTTAFDLIQTMNKKIKLMSDTLGYDSNKMILKVRSLNDYVFDLSKPMCNCTYIHECIKHNKEADYVIIPNPIYVKDKNENNKNKINNINNDNLINNNENEIDVNVSNSNFAQNLTCIHCPFDNLLSIAIHNPMTNNINNDIGNVNISLSKSVDSINNGKASNTQEDDLDLFINSLAKDLNNEIQSNYDYALNNIGGKEVNNLTKDSINEKYEIEDINEINNRLNASSVINISTINTTSQPAYYALPRRSKRGTLKLEVPNVFLPEQQNFEKNEIDNICKIDDSPINIRDVDRPFSILLKGAHLKELLNSTPFERKINSIFIFKVQLFLGSEPFSKPYEITWKNGNKDLDPVLNKRIYFDINYNAIPNFCSILFRIKYLQYNDLGTLITNTTKYWGNFKLFDHSMRLKCGLHKLVLYDRLFTDDAYYYFCDNDEEVKSSKIFFEIENFNKIVINKITHIKNYNSDANKDINCISDSLKKQLEDMKKKSPFEDLNNYDKDLLWNNRFKLLDDTEFLPKILLCVDYSDPKKLIELEKLLEIAKPLPTIKCLELLNGKYIHESIRNFAVKCLRESPIIEIQEYLYELIHGLRYEVNHDNELAKFLLEKAVKHPVTIGHNFYWLLKSQMYEQNFQQRYGLYLEIFLNKLGPNLTKIYYDEDILMTNLQEIALKQLENKSQKNNQNNFFTESVAAFNEKLENELGEISLPLNFKYRIKKINAENCKVIIKNGNHVKLIIDFQNADRFGDDLLISYYNDQDIRTNLITMHLYNIVHTIWCENNLKIKMPLYDVMTTGRNKGLIQLFPNSKKYEEIYHKMNSKLKKFFELNCGMSEKDIFDNFMTSLVGYSVANYIFGITQRNKKNINIKDDAQIFYTSYEHLLNHYSKLHGDRGEPFYISKYFVEYFGGKNGEKMKQFRKLFEDAYLVLRNRGNDLIILLTILLSSGFPEISKKSIMFLNMTLALTKTEAEAKDILKTVINYVMSK